MNDQRAKEARRKWRLILGPYSEALEDGSSETVLKPGDVRRDAMLHFLYQREYADRQMDCDSREGGKGPSLLTAPEWLRSVERLFPKSTFETLQRHALERYGLAELVLQPEALQNATPSLELVETLIGFRSLLPAESMDIARGIIRRVAKELEEKLALKVKTTLRGPRGKLKHGGRPSLGNLDWKHTIRRNLKNYSFEEGAPLLERLYFFQRNREIEFVPWDIFILVDQSASMLCSVIHAAIMAGVFASVNCLKSHLILFDTTVVDMTGQVDDPVEVLLGVQLGGGTDIGNALEYARGLITRPSRSMVLVVSDFYEGGEFAALETAVKRLRDSGATILGLAALDENAHPDYDRDAARRLGDSGMPIGAMTPDRLCEWISTIMKKKGVAS